jgi:hypothetical protein
MAGNKGKVGGRAKSGVVAVRGCDFCGKNGQIEKEIVRIKHFSGTGRGKMMWACKDGLCR